MQESTNQEIKPVIDSNQLAANQETVITINNHQYKVITEISSEEGNVIDSLLQIFMSEKNLKYKE